MGGVEVERIEYLNDYNPSGFDSQTVIRYTGVDDTKLISKTTTYPADGRVRSEYLEIEDTDFSAAPTTESARNEYRRGNLEGTAPDRIFTVPVPSGGFAEEVARYQMPTVAGESTKLVAVTDRFGNTAYSETWICTGASADPTTATYQLAERRSYSYDPRGRILKEWHGSAAGAMHLVSENSYPSETETVSVDSTGVVTTTFSRPGGTVYETVRGTGASAVTTEYTSGTVVGSGGKVYEEQTEVTTGGGQSTTTSTLIDLAGRVINSIDAAGLITTYSYVPSAGQTTTFFPNGSSTTTNRYLDGQVASVTGTANSAIYYDHSYDPNTGFLKSTTYSGTDLSPRYTSTTTDWTGRVVESVRPNTSGGTIETGYGYSTSQSGGQVVTVSQAGLADRIQEDNPPGAPSVSGLDIDNNGLQGDSNTDQYSTSDSRYVYIDNAWWRYSETKAADTPGSDVLVQTSYQRIRLAPKLEGSQLLLSETFSVSPGGNPAGTTSKTLVDRANKTVTQTVEHHGVSDIVGTSITVNNGLLTKSRGTTDAAFTEYFYDGLGRSTGYRDPRTGRRTTTHYSDATGQVDYTIDLEGNVTTTTYHPQGMLGAGQPATVTNPDGTTSFYTYNLRGQVVAIRGNAGYPLDYEYDAVYGELWKLNTYRDLGNPGLKSTTTWVNDPATGLLLQKFDGEGRVTTYTYHPETNLPHEIVRHSGNKIITEQDDAGRTHTREVTGTFPGKREFLYDRMGRLSNADDLSGYQDHNWALGYSPGGGLTSELITGAGPLGGLHVNHTPDASGRPYALQAGFGGEHVDVRYSYTAQSRLLAVEDLNRGLRATYTYHPGSDLVETVTSSESGTKRAVTTQFYRPGGQLLAISTRDAATGGVISAHGYHFDAMGRRTRADRHDGTYWEYGYNSRGEVDTAAKFFGGTGANPERLAGFSFGYTYDDIGNRTSASSGGDGSGNAMRTTSYASNNKLNQYTAITNPGFFEVSGSAPGQVSVTAPGSTPSAVGLQPAGNPRFFSSEVAVDNSGGSVYQHVTATAGATTEEADKFVYPANEAPVHDVDGNLAGDGRWDYQWDADNRLRVMFTDPAAAARVTATGPGGANASVPKRRLEFDYDYLGRRTSKRVYTWAGGSTYDAATAAVFTNWSETGSQKFIYDGWNVIARYSTGNNNPPEQTYLWGKDLSGSMGGAGGVCGLLAVGSATGEWFTAYDGNGNLVATIDASDSSVVSRREYSAFGEPLQSSPDDEVPFRFSTKYEDAETGMLYYGFRYYLPTTGRWLSRDPIGEDGGLNLYGFVGNDGVNHWDYLGKITIGFRGFNGLTSRGGDNEGNIKMEKINDLVGSRPDLYDSDVFNRKGNVRRAFDDLLNDLDSKSKGGNGDGKYGPGDKKQPIKIFGWSWGGISAVRLARKINKSKKFCWKEIEVLATVDPDKLFYFIGSEKVPGNVKKLWNRYQTKGTGGLPRNSHGEELRGTKLATENGVLDDQDDLNETGDEKTFRYGPNPAIISHHTIIWEVEAELIGILR